MKRFIHLVASLATPLGQRPKTPIRWLCLRTFIYIARTESTHLPADKLTTLNRAVELGVLLNRWFDGKSDFARKRYRCLRKSLPTKPTGHYLQALRTLEKNRPHHNNGSAVLLYRQRVLEVSLNYLFELADLKPRQILLPLCSLIQLIDDLLDQNEDRKRQLPTFVTATELGALNLAKNFWRQLQSHSEPNELPILACGWLVYILCRVTIVCFRS